VQEEQRTRSGAPQPRRRDLQLTVGPVTHARLAHPGSGRPERANHPEDHREVADPLDLLAGLVEGDAEWRLLGEGGKQHPQDDDRDECRRNEEVKLLFETLGDDAEVVSRRRHGRGCPLGSETRRTKESLANGVPV